MVALNSVYDVARGYADGSLDVGDAWNWLCDHDLVAPDDPRAYELAGLLMLLISEVSSHHRTEAEARELCAHELEVLGRAGETRTRAAG